MKKFVFLTLVLSVSLHACSSPKQNQPIPSVAEPPPQKTDEVTLSAGARDRLELKSVIVETRTAVESLSTTGEIRSDESRVFHIHSLANGRVVRENAALGQAVKSGQVVAVIQNLEIVKIYSDFIHQSHQNQVNTELAETKWELAQKNHARIKTLFAEQIAPEKELIKAESDLKIEEQTVHGLKEHAGHLREEARAMLAAYGVNLPAKLQDTIESTSPIVSPRAGVIIKKNVTVGDVVSSAEPLYVVADLSKVWLDLVVYDKQLMSIRPGSTVMFQSDSLPGRTFSGQVFYVKPSTEENSGTFVARVTLENPRFDLKPGMLGQVKVQNHSTASLPFVPEEALQKYANETFVFLDKKNGTYKKRNIVLGPRIPGGYLADSGLAAGERIVTAGSFALKAEMLKSSFSEDE